MRLDRWLARLLVVIALLALPQSALAAEHPGELHGDGAEARLIVAETLGGATIRFECGQELVTIALTEPTEIPGEPGEPVFLRLTSGRLEASAWVAQKGRKGYTIGVLDQGSFASKAGSICLRGPAMLVMITAKYPPHRCDA